jgi:hypothetical protein
MSVPSISIPSESKLRDYFFDGMDGRELDLLIEYADLSMSVEDLGDKLQKSFGEKSIWIKNGIISLSLLTPLHTQYG